MKHNNAKFKKFWRSLERSERMAIANKAGRNLEHIEQIASGARLMGMATAFDLMDADSRITMYMCFPERMK